MPHPEAKRQSMEKWITILHKKRYVKQWEGGLKFYACWFVEGQKTPSAPFRLYDNLVWNPMTGVGSDNICIPRPVF